MRGYRSADPLPQALGEVVSPPGLLGDSVCKRDLVYYDSRECSSSKVHRGVGGEKAEDISVCVLVSHVCVIEGHIENNTNHNHITINNDSNGSSAKGS